MSMNSVKLIFTAFLLLSLISITGCVAVVANGGTLVAKGLPRAELEKKAENGDVQAQYELGLANCCMGVGFSTQVATEWLCKAARQNHPDAMYELGRIYLGDVSRTPAPGQKLLRLATARQSHSHAYMWLSLAEQNGQEKAEKKLAKLGGDISEENKLASVSLLQDWKNAACEYDQVFPSLD